MQISSIMLPCDGAISGLSETSARPAHDLAEATLLLQDHGLLRDHGRIARGMSDIVVHRLFSAGLALETALKLIGDHPGVSKIQEAIGELDLAIRDFRNSAFDHRHPDLPHGGPAG